MTRADSKQIELPSVFDELEKIEGFIDELQAWAQFDDGAYGNIMLALSEAVTNAIVHGNKLDPDKKVHVEAGLKENRLTVSVKDEGPGFDSASLPDPLKEENLMNEGGRGVYIMEQYADKVSYSENGTKITLVFYL